MTTEPIIEVQGLWYAYNGAPVLTDVNLRLNEGEFLAIIGPNGGGKTTLLKLLLGLLAPSQGMVRVLGMPPREAVSHVGYVPQDTGFRRGVPVTVLQVVLMGLLRGGGSWRRVSVEERRAAEDALLRLGVWNLKDRRMDALSGGQRQRVLVARALAGDPRLLLLDEPTASVDTQGRAELYKLLKEINERTTVVVVSHDMMVLSSYIKSVACVNRELHFHDRPEITRDMLQMAYQCPVELIAHGVPHRVLDHHEG